ncbi:glycosyltransferase family 25 protein [Mesorhizobium qingshengii]|uniref:glycosyltransferase family 25 protein n=1 Tax=Mesorhizobium qingshengii TaxID=1165689 RepID=UPI001428C877|nr:glycosyltransferase family 25 protein [Mesorhizobium qingshengii]
MINLDRSIDRLADVTAEFSRIGIPFERVAAVDAAAGAPFIGPPLTEAEICCFLSHRLCWQSIADGPDRYGAVFEDDVVFSHNAGPVLNDDAWVPRDADVVKLETFFVRVRIGRRHVPVKNGYSATRLLGHHLGACGYLISKKAAQKLLKNTRRLRAAVDVALFSPDEMTTVLNTTYQLMPALCAQAKFISENDSPATLIQVTPRLHRDKRVIDRIRAEATRVFGQLRNRSFFATEKVDAVPLRFPLAAHADIDPKPVPA